MKKIYLVLASVCVVVSSVASGAEMAQASVRDRVESNSEVTIGAYTYHYSIAAENFNEVIVNGKQQYVYDLKTTVMRCNKNGMGCVWKPVVGAVYRQGKFVGSVVQGKSLLKQSGDVGQTVSMTLSVKSGSRYYSAGRLDFDLSPKPIALPPVVSPPVHTTPTTPVVTPVVTPTTPTPVTPVVLPNPDYSPTGGTLLSQYIASGAQNVPFATYNFAPNPGSPGMLEINELKFVITPSPTGVSPITGISVGGAYAPVVNNVAYLTGLNLSVPASASGVKVQAYANFAQVGNGGVLGYSGIIPSAEISLAYVKYRNSLESLTMCTAALGSCSQGLPTGGVSPTGQVFYLVGAKPRIAVASTNTVLIPGQSVGVVDVAVTAQGSGDIKLKQLPIALALSSGAGGVAAISAVSLAEINGASIPGVAVSVPSSFSTGTVNAVFASGSEYTISAGATKVFRVFVTISGNLGSGASLGAGLDATPTGKQSFLWYDVTGGMNATGEFIYDYPVSSVLIKN